MELNSSSFFILLALIIILARLAGQIMDFFRLPTVIGEILLGMFLGLFPIFGSDFHTHPVIQFFTEFGAVILLFMVGLESTFAELVKVGRAALLVAVIGMAVPMSLGIGVSYLLKATPFWAGHIFVGATLAATSVGLTARVLKDLGQSKSTESRIILAAAVIDDILGLILLAIVTAYAKASDSGIIDFISLLGLLIKALGFIVGALLVGRFVLHPLFFSMSKVGGRGAQLISTLSFCLVMSGLAHQFGLAPIVGAFFAGLVLQPTHFDKFKEHSEYRIDDQLNPLSVVFIPLFFVITGMKVDLRVFLNPSVLWLGILIAVVAIFGKLASGLVSGKNARSWVVGVGMIPRGEVGIIFASLATSLSIQGQPIFSSHLFGAMLMMVIVTSIVSPIWLGKLLNNKRQK